VHATGTHGDVSHDTGLTVLPENVANSLRPISSRTRTAMVSSNKRTASGIVTDAPASTARASASHALDGGVRRQRRVYDASFKLMVVQEALKLPASNRIKPTCRAYPGVEPVRTAARALVLPALCELAFCIPPFLSATFLHATLTASGSTYAGASAQVDPEP
jgi:hypothetical protein